MKIKNLATVSLVGLVACPALADTFTLSAVATNRILTFDTGRVDPDLLSVYNDGSTNIQHSLLQFDYSPLSGATVTSAVLWLYGDAYLGGNAVQTTDFYRVNRHWTSTGASWNNATATTTWTNPGGDYVGTTGQQATNPFTSVTAAMGGSAPHWFQYDLTSLVAGTVEGTYTPDNGIMIVGDSGNQLTWTSNYDPNVALHPYLVVNTTSVPEPWVSGVLGIGVFGLLARRRK